MGILIGASLCIAGALLRKSAARNLQVLVYIGALLFCVSVLLLGVQCSARKAARKRKKALRNAKRCITIPMETLNSRNVPAVQPQIAFVNNTQRYVININKAMHTQEAFYFRNHSFVFRTLPVTAVPSAGVVQMQRPVGWNLEEQQGVPWWRRKELTSNF